ncbi:MAG: 3-hydroxyacyl-CoA dehydrogenase family protein [Ginsengibacter sp.]
MQIVILANAEQKKELLSKSKNENVNIEYVNEYEELTNYTNADALFIFQDELNIPYISLITQPLFIHSVIATLDDLNLGNNVSRVNAWPTFLQRNLWEVSTKDKVLVKNILEGVGWKYLVTPDEPGFIAARIIAMIINEAYFTYEEKISTKEEIDAAMKLGTNYPYGPFEWAQKIRLQNIYNLLNALHKKDERYMPALTIERELTSI